MRRGEGERRGGEKGSRYTRRRKKRWKEGRDNEKGWGQMSDRKTLTWRRGKRTKKGRRRTKEKKGEKGERE